MYSSKPLTLLVHVSSSSSSSARTYEALHAAFNLFQGRHVNCSLYVLYAQAQFVFLVFQPFCLQIQSFVLLFASSRSPLTTKK